MIKNVGKVDRALRVLLGIALVIIGLFPLKGSEGNTAGIIMALISLVPFYMAITQSCIVFRWFKIHSLTKKECSMYGAPYSEKGN